MRRLFLLFGVVALTGSWVYSFASSAGQLRALVDSLNGLMAEVTPAPPREGLAAAAVAANEPTANGVTSGARAAPVLPAGHSPAVQADGGTWRDEHPSEASEVSRDVVRRAAVMNALENEVPAEAYPAAADEFLRALESR